jgi:hypothetical protein
MSESACTPVCKLRLITDSLQVVAALLVTMLCSIYSAVLWV